MNFSSIEELFQVYVRAFLDNRVIYGIIGILIAFVTLFLAETWPKSYTATSTIYADNSNLLRPLLGGTVISSNMVDQARMAKDILFSNEYIDPILESAGIIDIDGLSPLEKNELINEIEGNTRISNRGRGAARLIGILHSDQDPIKAFRITQKYTAIFIEQAALNEQGDSQRAFDFVEGQVLSYQQRLQASEASLSAFKTENNLGTLANANNRMASYRADIERLDLELTQIDRQVESVESQLAGELVIARDLSQVNSIKSRINSLQFTLDSLRSRFHDTYPDVVQVKDQIMVLREMLESGNTSGYMTSDQLTAEGITSLQRELRSRLSILQTEKEAKLGQKDGALSLLSAEGLKYRRINDTEAELAELTRDYNVTRSFYNTMLQRLENARVNVQMNEDQQGITFKIQESASIPTQPDGLSFSQMMIASLLFSMGVPLGLMVVMVEVDPRIRSEHKWPDDWPPLLATVVPYEADGSQWGSTILYFTVLVLIVLGLYGTSGYLHITGFFAS